MLLTFASEAFQVLQEILQFGLRQHPAGHRRAQLPSGRVHPLSDRAREENVGVGSALPVPRRGRSQRFDECRVRDIGHHHASFPPALAVRSVTVRAEDPFGRQQAFPCTEQPERERAARKAPAHIDHLSARFRRRQRRALGKRIGPERNGNQQSCGENGAAEKASRKHRYEVQGSIKRPERDFFRPFSALRLDQAFAVQINSFVSPDSPARLLASRRRGCTP